VTTTEQILMSMTVSARHTTGTQPSHGSAPEGLPGPHAWPFCSGSRRTSDAEVARVAEQWRVEFLEIRSRRPRIRPADAEDRKKRGAIDVGAYKARGQYASARPTRVAVLSRRIRVRCDEDRRSSVDFQDVPPEDRVPRARGGNHAALGTRLPWRKAWRQSG
jgi:hypothetical protein